MKGKIIHRPALEGGVQLVASGEAEIGFYPKSEVINTDGLSVVGPLPRRHSAYDDLRCSRDSSKPGAGRRQGLYCLHDRSGAPVRMVPRRFRSAGLSLRRLQLHVDVLFLREGEHLLKAFLTSQPRLLEAAEGRAEEVLAHLVDPDIAGLDRKRGAMRR